MPSFIFNTENEDGTSGTDGIEIVAADEERARAALAKRDNAEREPVVLLVSVDGRAV